MDPNQNSPAQPNQNQPPAPGVPPIPGSTKPETEAPPERVFEFTSDLNIAPIKSAEDPRPAPIPPEARPKTPLQEAIGRLNVPPKVRQQLSGIPATPPEQSSPGPTRPPQSPQRSQASPEIRPSSQPPANVRPLQVPGLPEQTPKPTPEPAQPHRRINLLEDEEASPQKTPTQVNGGNGISPQKATDESEGINAHEMPFANMSMPISPKGETQAKPLVMNTLGDKIVETPTFEGKDPQKALRTYESDVAEALAKKRLSTASIFIAEKDRKEKQMMTDGKPPETKKTDTKIPTTEKATPERTPAERAAESSVPKSIAMQKPDTPDEEEAEKKYHARPGGGKKLFISLISMIFILGGIIAAYILYSMSPLAPTTPANPTSSQTLRSVIPFDTQIIIAIDGMSANDILSRIKEEAEKPQTANTIREIVLTGTADSKVVRVPASQMLRIMNISAPAMLIRALADDWMIGTYSDSYGHKETFVVATHNFFQNAFAGMLSWENTMADSLKQYLYPGVAGVAGVTNVTDEQTPVVSATAGSPTDVTAAPVQPAPSSFTIRGRFVDGIVKNKDVREFLTDNGTILFLYSFINNNKLVVTSGEATLAEIITRLEQQTFIR